MTPITPPRVPFLDARTGLIDRAWYMFFLSLFNSAASPDALVQPDANSLLATFDAQLRDLADAVGRQFDAQSGVASLAALLAEVERQFAVAPPTMTGELEQALASLRQDLSLMPSAQAVVFDIVGPAVAGSIAYGNGSSVAFSAAGTSGQVLVSNGAGAPSWSTLSNVTSISFGTTGLTPASATSGAVTVAGTLAVANGGTGLTSWTANGVVYASGATTLTNGSSLIFNGSTFAVQGGVSLFASSAVAGAYQQLDFPAGVYGKAAIRGYSVTTGDEGELRLYTAPSGDVIKERLRIDADGNVIVNTAAIATTATNGFLYVPTCAGTPTGTPTAYTGRAPIVVDTTNNKLYFYSGGSWRDAGP